MLKAEILVAAGKEVCNLERTITEDNCCTTEIKKIIVKQAFQKKKNVLPINM